MAVFLVFPGGLFAQEIDSASKTSKSSSPDPRITVQVWQESIADLRKSAQELLGENDKLTTDNGALFGQITDIQKSIVNTKEENIRLLAEPPRLKKLIAAQDAENKILQKTVKDLENQLALLNKEKAALEQKLARLEERQKPWEAQLAKLNARKTELDVEVKITESSPQEEAEKLKAEVEMQKNLISQSQQKEAELKNALAEASKLYALPQEDLKRLKAENQALEAEIAKTNNSRKLTTKEIETLSKKGSGELNKGLLDKNQDQQKNLESKNQILETDIAKLRQLLENPQSVDLSQGREALYQKIDELDREKHGLEDRIFDLSEAIVVLKRDNAIVEALIDTQAQLSSQMVAAQEQSTAEAMAYAYASQGMFEEAIGQYQEALKQGGSKKSIYFNLGYVQYKLGNIEEALKNYKLVLKLDPDDIEARQNLEQLRRDYRAQKMQ